MGKIKGAWIKLSFITLWVAVLLSMGGCGKNDEKRWMQETEKKYNIHFQSAVSSQIDLIYGGIPTQAKKVLQEYPAVGFLIQKASSGKWGAGCTATLIASDTLITAAHCFNGSPSPAVGKFNVYFQHAGVFTVKSIKFFCSSATCTDDLALIKLANAPSLDWYPVVNNQLPPAFDAEIVGFGHAAINGDPGIKRFGSLVPDLCAKQDPDSPCFEYQSNSLEACSHDSGGPLLIKRAASFRLVGVATKGSSGCTGGAKGKWVNLTHNKYSNWLNAFKTNPPAANPVSPKKSVFDEIDYGDSKEIFIPSGARQINVNYQGRAGDLSLSGVSNCENRFTVSSCSPALDRLTIRNNSPSRVKSWYQVVVL